ncbi:hypothetical protein AAVH_16912 [Aphelenchoides avenae]|nr:hypothetical protein AAVH_16912 [Aphelenchus avenae]
MHVSCFIKPGIREEDAVAEARHEIRPIVGEAVDAAQVSPAEKRQDDTSANFAFGAASHCGFKVPDVPAKPNGRHGLRVGDESLRYVKGTTMTVKQYACTMCNQPFWASYKKNGKNKYRLFEDPTRHRCNHAPYGRQPPVVKQEVDDFESYSRSSSVTSSVLFGSQTPKQEGSRFSPFSRASSAASYQKPSARNVKCTMPDGTSFEVDDPEDFVRFRKAYDQVKNEE